MPNLDFLTLYILIFLNSLAVAAVWAGFAYSYRPHRAALHWLGATLLTLLGGIVLAIQGNEGALVPAVVGNTIIIFGFTQFWVGLRRFRHQSGGQILAVTLTLIAAAAMIAMHDSARGRAIVYAAGQSSVMLLCLIHLVRNRLPGIGAIIAVSAFAVAMAGQWLVIGSNWALLANLLDYSLYYSLASYALLCTVFSATVWNLGFALMSVDRLQLTLRRLSETDELTGLANRRAFQQRMDALQAAPDGREHSLILIDLNDFKPLNDRHGHTAGDEALRHLARLLTGIGGRNLVARLGGDEFAVLLPEAGLSQAEHLAATIRKTLAASPLELSDDTVTLSASLGVSAASEGADLFALADQRLYSEKHLGKGRQAHRPKSALEFVKTAQTGGLDRALNPPVTPASAAPARHHRPSG